MKTTKVREGKIKAFHNQKHFRNNDSFIYARVYYNHSLKYKIFKEMLKIAVKNKSPPKDSFLKDEN